MTQTFRLSLAQLNPIVGDLEGNVAKARAAWEQAKAAGADMVALPEMFVTGYQVQDIVMKPAFTQHAMRLVEALAPQLADGPAMGIGHPQLIDGALYNAYSILKAGKVKTRVLKHELPNFNVFDEKRVYEKGPVQGPYAIDPLRIGTPICEDAWHEEVSETLAESGAQILLVPNGSPYFRGKHDIRMSHIWSRAWSKRGCLWSISTWWAGRMIRSLTAALSC